MQNVLTSAPRMLEWSETLLRRRVSRTGVRRYRSKKKGLALPRALSSMPPCDPSVVRTPVRCAPSGALHRPDVILDSDSAR